MADQGEKVSIQNVNVPSYVGRVDAKKYEATKQALMQILPDDGLGLTQTQMFARIKLVIDQQLFPKGAKSGWWAKTVQLDLEAKGVIIRHHAKPLRWSKR